jgi:hypothetical protein
MAKKTVHNEFFDDVVPANSTKIDNTPIIPDGKALTLREFGGTDPGIGDNIHSEMALQWGSGAGGWETVRAGTRHFNFTIPREYVGDGVKRFRFIRINKSATAKKIVVWSNSLLHDA